MTSPTDSARVLALDDPQLRFLLPLLYVAWADLDLSDEEKSVLANHVAAQPWLRPAARQAALEWLDPKSPPEESELRSLGELLARVARTASPRARITFHALAHQLATTEEMKQVVDQMASLLGAEMALPAKWGVVPPAPQPAFEGNPGVSRALMAFLDGAHADERKVVREFLDSSTRRAYGLSVETMRDHTREQLEAFAHTGLIERAFPGVTSEGELDAFMAVFEELGHGDLSLAVKLGVQAGLYGGALWALGSERHHRRLPAVAALEELGCFAMSEVGHGSNVFDLETVARYDHETRQLVIFTPAESARKEWIGGAARDARFAVVFAQLDVADERHGVHAILVPIRAPDGAPVPGVRTGDSGHKMGLLGVDNGRLWFEHVRVPVENLLDRFASIDEEGHYQSPIESQSRRFFTMLATLVGGRICVGSAAVSAARTSLAIALRYATVRRQFSAAPGEPERALLEYPSHQRRLLPHIAESVVLRVAFEALRRRHRQTTRRGEGTSGREQRHLEAEVAILKVLGSRHGVDATQACREACGGQGYLSVNRLADIRADVEIFTTFEGDNVVLAQLVAKELLSNYRHQFADEGAFAVARILGRRALTRAVEKNPVSARLRDAKHLSSREFQLTAFRYREERIIETLAARLRKRLKEGMDLDLAFLKVQDHALAASRAFGERLAFESFALAEKNAVESAGGGPTDEETKMLLQLLGDVHALGLFEKHAAWFLEDGYIEAAKSRAIRLRLNGALSDLAPHARTVVDAFGIGDECLAAPIAFFDPAHPTYV